jgi:hypothetical protein
VDEGLQIHGGYGFSEEYSPARSTRDARINRIFEGTNEINRLFIPSTLLRRAERGRFPVPASPPNPPPLPASTVAPLDRAGILLQGAKQLALWLTGLAVQKFGKQLTEQQEVVAAISDIVIDIFLDESALLRTKKHLAAGKPAAAMTDLTLSLMNDSVSRMEQRATTALVACLQGDELDTALVLMRRCLPWTPLNVVELRRRVAKRLCDVGSYPALVAG